MALFRCSSCHLTYDTLRPEPSCPQCGDNGVPIEELGGEVLEPAPRAVTGQFEISSLLRLGKEAAAEARTDNDTVDGPADEPLPKRSDR